MQHLRPVSLIGLALSGVLVLSACGGASDPAAGSDSPATSTVASSSVKSGAGDEAQGAADASKLASKRQVANATELSAHVLDSTTGKPAVGVPLTLTTVDGQVLTSAMTDAEGRVRELAWVEPGTYRLVIDTGSYFPQGFFPEVVITFRADGKHVHIPLLLSPFSYTTYRGS